MISLVSDVKYSLNHLIGKHVKVILKNGITCEGLLRCLDPHLNMLIENDTLVHVIRGDNLAVIEAKRSAFPSTEWGEEK